MSKTQIFINLLKAIILVASLTSLLVGVVMVVVISILSHLIELLKVVVPYAL